MSIILNKKKDIINCINSKELDLIGFEKNILNLIRNNNRNDNSQKIIKNEITIFFIKLSDVLHIAHSEIMNIHNDKSVKFSAFEDDIYDYCNKFEIKDYKGITTKKDLKKYKMEKIEKARYWLLEKYKMFGVLSYIDPKEFVSEKLFDVIDVEKIEHNQKIQEYQIKSISQMKDNYKISVKRNNQWSEIDQTQSDYIIAFHEISHSLIKHKMKKYPKIGSALEDILIVNNYKLEEALRVSDKIIENKNIFKNKKIDIFTLINKLNFNVEHVEDVLDEIIELNKIEKFMLSIMSNKYKHLIIEDNEDLRVVKYSIFKSDIIDSFKELKNSGVTISELQQYIGVKLEKYKNSEELECDLDKLNNLFNEFDLKSIERKASNQNTQIVHKNENLLIIEVMDFKSSKTLGSQSWCISNYENDWDDYVSDNSKQFFVYNFTKDSKKKDSMIGITLKDKKGQDKLVLKASHYKDDSSVEKDSYNLKLYIKKINKYVLDKNPSNIKKITK